MRSVIQRVTAASVTVDSAVVGAIGPGILALVGFTHDDSERDLVYCADKILGIRIFDDRDGNMNLSLADIGGGLLVVSQFTLYGDTRRGRRPSYSAAMPGDRSKKFFEDFIGLCRQRHAKVETGIFGADMAVSLINDGPVTLLVDSDRTG